MPTTAVYLNPDFIAGLLQEIFQTGLLESSESEAARSTSDSVVGVIGDSQASVNESLIAMVNGVGGETLASVDAATAGDSRDVTRSRYVFSQTYYLDRVRRVLREQGLLRNVSGRVSAAGVGPGQFVEYTGRFTANEVNALLDIVSPELISSVTRFAYRRKAHVAMRDVEEFELLKVRRELHEHIAADYAELGGAIGAAIRQDFRSENTKEFYAEIGTDDDEIRVVTVCEASYFVTADPDRLLDGQFTVLAKVISGAREDVPILDRNKLLNRVNPAFFKEVVSGLNTTSVFGSGYDESPVDLTIPTVIEGWSFTVMPVAIYI
ncbi:DUF6414 family protein [Rhodococcus erythropolis]